MNINDLSELIEKFAAASGGKQYVYHIKSSEFKGKYIYPLSELEQVNPEMYRAAFKKYEGREDWIGRKIPRLGCTARDVVNLSTINPIKLFIVEMLLGIESIDDKVIMKIPVSAIKKQESVLFSYGSELVYKYKKQDIAKYRECQTVPLDTVEHYIESKRKSESPLIFEYVPHILVRGKVDISGAEIIKFREKDLQKWLKNQ